MPEAIPLSLVRRPKSLGLQGSTFARTEGTHIAPRVFSEGIGKAQDIARGIPDAIGNLFDDAARVFGEVVDKAGMILFEGQGDGADVAAQGLPGSAGPPGTQRSGQAPIMLGGIALAAVVGFIFARALRER